MKISDLLGSEGPLAKALPGFSPRAPQQQMAQAVAAVLASGDTLVIEAGTGTGKTFAYLAPAIALGKPVIISTGTRNLQDQLYHRDLPTVRKALAKPVKTALLKGRSNYLCLHRLERPATLPRSAQLQGQLQRIRSWAGRTRSGDVGEISDIPEDSPLWPQVTSTVDNCLGAECPQLRDCFVLKARREALEADILVINHHLFFADMVLREDGFGEVLPTSAAMIFDEAHQLPELAGQFFGRRLSSRQLTELCRDTQAEQQRDAPDFVDLSRATLPVEQALAQLRGALGKEGRVPWPRVAAVATPIAHQLDAALAELEQGLAAAAERGKGLASCYQRCQALRQNLQRLTDNVVEEANSADALPGGSAPAGGAAGGATAQSLAASAASAPGVVRWCEVTGRGFTLWQTPLDISAAFRDYRERAGGAWILTSATLAVDGSFDHFTERLGLDAATTQRLESPFDYRRCAVLYHPTELPPPHHPDYTDAVLNAALPLIEASGGGAFLLFTSHRALRYAAERLSGQLTYPLLVQGSSPKGELLTRFSRLGNAVLLGTGSFWEGVDVKGAALALVVIDRLPFAAPDDPVLGARLDALRRRGVDPFTHYQLPQAVIALKQGAGRLIRDVHDRGVLMICDPRLSQRAYGQTFLASLPPMLRTRRGDRARGFLAHYRQRLDHSSS